MRLFYVLGLVVVFSALVVFGYDLFQAEVEKEHDPPRILYDFRTKKLTFEKPAGVVKIVYASMFAPGEPVMRVRDHWMDRFEEEYSERLSASATRAMSREERRRFVADRLRRVERVVQQARRRAREVDSAQNEASRTQRIDRLLAWLEEHLVFMENIAPEQTVARRRALVEELIGTLLALAADENAFEEVTVRVRRRVQVERRWQGRWVLSANRARFLTGREVPDIMVGSKMELLALVEDDYAVPLDEALPGEALSPLDGPDTYGDPRRRWRDAFVPTMLEEGKYPFIADAARRDKTYLAPLWCTSFCMFYNRALFRRAGIEKVPRTWPEFMDVCEKLKSHGIAPLTADQSVYADFWMMWLIFRALGPEAWEATITGVPADTPPQEREPEPPWTDPRYHEVFTQIRALRERGYFREGFRGLTWPAAQRGFASGDAAMMICGSWLVQELGGYKDIEKAGNFELGCFPFPRWPGGRKQDQQAAHAGCYGLMVCRQGRATRHAVELVKYLSAKDHHDMVYKNAQISCMRDAGFSPDLAGIEEDFKNATAIYDRTPSVYARRFGASTLAPLYTRFFLKGKGEPGFLSVDEFLQTLDRETRAYLKAGGEEGYE